MKESEYILTVGLEIHAELNTASKMWCGCKNDPDETRPNANICPICMAHPGTLPVINKEAVRKVLTVGTALGGTLADFTEFDRKNYFYPDIPKGYQLSQYKYPLVSGGELNGVKITRIHLEEDTATSKHDRGDFSLVDYNRAGVPLMELVTEPVIHDAKTAGNFAREFQLLLQYLGVGEANMEKGEMRIEANISVSKDPEKLGLRVEVKNLNSFSVAEKAIEYEYKRQVALLEKGEEMVQETRGFDENTGTTFSQRTKENAHDYRYFPDPDLPKLKLSDIPEFQLEELKKHVPELPWVRRARYQSWGLNADHTEFFASDPKAGDYFDDVINALDDEKEAYLLASNYIASDLAGLNKNGALEQFPQPHSIALLIKLIRTGSLSSRGAKDVLSKMVLSAYAEKSPEEIARELGVIQVNDESALQEIVEKVLADNPKAVDEYKAGKAASLQFLLGQCMKASKGAGNPELFKKILLEIM